MLHAREATEKNITPALLESKEDNLEQSCEMI